MEITVSVKPLLFMATVSQHYQSFFIHLTSFTIIMKISKSSWNFRKHTTLDKDTSFPQCRSCSPLSAVFGCSVAHFISNWLSWNYSMLNWKGILRTSCCSWGNQNIEAWSDLAKGRQRSGRSTWFSSGFCCFLSLNDITYMPVIKITSRL